MFELLRCPELLDIMEPRVGPEIIAAGSAHAAIDKACDMLRIKLVRVPILPGSCEMDVAAARAAVTPNTVMIYASAPNYPQARPCRLRLLLVLVLVLVLVVAVVAVVVVVVVVARARYYSSCRLCADAPPRAP